MVEYKVGDIFAFAEDADALVNTVNCVGVMGRGVALQFKRAFPANFKAYAAACRKKEVRPGRMFLFETRQLTNPRYIINFPTKRHWRGKSRIEDIEAGLNDLTRVIRSHDIRSVVLPPLGSGLGGLNWSEVRPRIESALAGLENLRAIVFEPGGGPTDDRANRSTEVPKMTPGRAALVVLMEKYLRGLLDPFVTLLEVHKLMYFLQHSGESLRLNFVKGHHGPYAENLRHVLRDMEGHMISGYADGGDAPGKPLELVPGALEDAKDCIANATRCRLDRVFELVDGFESPFGLELLSTVHWVVCEENAQTLEEIAKHAYEWGPRKKQFSERHLGIAAEVLASQGWFAESALRR